MSLKSSEKSERTYGLDSRNINKPSKNDNYTVTSLFRKLPNCRACFLLRVICTALTSGLPRHRKSAADGGFVHSRGLVRVLH